MWEQIRSNRRRAWFILAATFALLALVGGSVGVMFGGGDPQAMILGVVGAVALWLALWIGSIMGGDSAILHMAGARQVRKKSLPQLHNIVEEMSIAAGLDRKPKVYVVDDPAPNAFAAGRRPQDALVAVTTGLLAKLNRDELQGVIAHEIGHIKNRDVALMSLASVMVGAIALLGDVGMRSLWYGGGMRRSRSSNNNNGGWAIAVAILIVVLAPLIAQVLYFSLSRRREYLADASGARFSRYPEGLASALEKISGTAVAQGDQSKVTAPIYIVKPLSAAEAKSLKRGRKAQRASWFATHPPIAERVRILRSMGGGADYASYAKAAAAVTGSSMIGDTTLTADSPLSALTGHSDAGTPQGVASFTSPSSEIPAAAATPDPTPTQPPVAPAFSRREASDAFLTASGFEMRTCRNCAAVVKVPASLAKKVKRCPRCQSSL